MTDQCRLCPPGGQARWRSVVGSTLHGWADRIDPHGARRLTGWTFRFAPGRGVLFSSTRRDGCPVAYLGHDDYEKAHGSAS